MQYQCLNMVPPSNSIYIVIGEINMLVTALKRSARWSSHAHMEEEQDNILKSFRSLKDCLNEQSNINNVEPMEYLTPFLHVIRSENTSGLVTSYALTSVYRFLLYNFIDVARSTAAVAAENIADSVTHARFLGTDALTDEVVLLKIVEVLRLLLLMPLGRLLTNESVSEIIQSFFRMCFEARCSEILRTTSETALTDAVYLLFSCLPQFSDDCRSQERDKKKVTKTTHVVKEIGTKSLNDEKEKGSPLPVSTSIDGTSRNNDSTILQFDDHKTSEDLTSESAPSPLVTTELLPSETTKVATDGNYHVSVNSYDAAPPFLRQDTTDYVNPRGIRFTMNTVTKEGTEPLMPYGLTCVRHLFRWLVCLINPMDRHNSEMHIQVGLNMISVALEAGVDHIGKFPTLLGYIKDDMCRNLFSLLSTERLTVFVSTLQLFVLLFESLRTHLKFQLEMFFTKLVNITLSELPKISYEQREMSLDCIIQLWSIPGFVAELYINYDCDLYCSNLFEDITKLLSKNAFPLSGLYSVHLLSLDALLAVINSIESRCRHRILSQDSCTSVKKHYGSYLEHTDKCMSNEELPAQLCKASCPFTQDLKSSEETFNTNGAMLLTKQAICNDIRSGSSIRVNRIKASSEIPSHEMLQAVKQRKKILASGTEHFNNSPNKGISFLQEHSLLKEPLDPREVALFLRDNPKLDKKMIGEYISNRKNLKVLEAFVTSFSFENTRIDEALRQYLEAFRLPGEAPLISLVLEHFAEHWHVSNNKPFANSDAAFTLAYAIIMLNVDQHNYNVKKQNIPMTLDEFKRNLKNVNGNEDFDENMLEDIYMSIKSQEIVMPAEQTGIVKENYIYKVLLRRGSGKEGKFIHVPNGMFNHDLFTLVWGSTVAALSFIFDKSTESTVIEKTVSGFHKCALIAAHYEMNDMFDNLIISICKFTTLVNSTESSRTLPVSFGSNTKAQMATKTLFKMVHCHGDILKDGWKNVLDCILHLFKAKMLPTDLMEAEDFVSPNRVISLVREDTSSIPRTESGLLSSFYSYITSDSPSQRSLAYEDELAKQSAIDCIKGCHCEHLIEESKFVRTESLQELVKSLIIACRIPDTNAIEAPNVFDENSSVFILELLIKIVLLNRDRIMHIWKGIQDHLHTLVINTAATDHIYLLERTIVGILRIAVRLICKEEMQVLQSFKILLFIKTAVLLQISRQVAFALHEILQTNAANIHSKEYWSCIFSLFEKVGAGVKIEEKVLCTKSGVTHNMEQSGAQSDSELSIGRHPEVSQLKRNYTSDSELYESQIKTSHPSHTLNSTCAVVIESNSFVNKDYSTESDCNRILAQTNYAISLHQETLPHDPLSYLKCCESLVFLVRDAHITVDNFTSCVHCVRTFIEAGAFEDHSYSHRKPMKCKSHIPREKKQKVISEPKKKEKTRHSPVLSLNQNEGYDADDEEKSDNLSPAYQQVTLQLLDLLHTLHTRAAAIFEDHTEKCNGLQLKTRTKDLWLNCWCPILQGIANLCCDARRVIRTSAFTVLHRALLVHDLQVLAPIEWESCFIKVLFPLLSKLLENISHQDQIGIEESRMRAVTVLCKVFLQHLTPLLTLPTFMALWLTILDFMDKYMHADGSGLLAEAIPELLKNLLLVMETAGIFKKFEEQNHNIWYITWDRINSFLPNLKNELFKPSSMVPVTVMSTPRESVKEILTDSTVTHTDRNEYITATKHSLSEKDESPDITVLVEKSAIVNFPNELCDSQAPSPVSLILQPPSLPVCNVTPSPQISSYGSDSVPLLLKPSLVTEPQIPVFATPINEISDVTSNSMVKIPNT